MPLPRILTHPCAVIERARAAANVQLLVSGERKARLAGYQGAYPERLPLITDHLEDLASTVQDFHLKPEITRMVQRSRPNVKYMRLSGSYGQHVRQAAEKF